MENKDILDETTQPLPDQPDTLTDADAVTVNGGTTDETVAEATQQAPAEPVGSELAELKDKYLRLYADFENFRRRTAKEKLELIGTANESLLLTLLPVVDDFERAMQAAETAPDINTLKEGISLIHSKLTRTLEAKGLKPMVAKGAPFNADLHESVTQFPAPSDDMKGKVIDEIERGYTLNDKVIRFAKVIVGA
jgi:molecular chaperone GrpE